MTSAETVAYLRQSLDRDDDEYGVDRQRADITKLCANRGWTVAREYKDNDESATPERRKGKPRPQYTAMLADMADGKIGRVLVANSERLVRHNRELEDIIDICNTHGVALVTAHGDIDLSNDHGRTVARILCSVARGEIERKSARHKKALAQRAERGAAWWASRPFGYTTAVESADGKWKPKGQKIILHPVEAALARKAYADVLAGASLYSIANEWNDNGVVTPRGNRWRGAQLRQFLLSERNAGLRTYNGEIVGDGDWPKIVDRDVFDGVAAILADPKRLSSGSRTRVHLLSGLVHCGKCGVPMKAVITGHRNVYGCRERGCMGVARAAEPLERFITGLVVSRLSQPDAGDLVLADSGPDTAELRQRAAALRAKIDESRQLYEDGVLSAVELRITRENLKVKLADIDARLHDANRARVFDGVIDAADVAAAFDALPLDRKRAVIDTLLTITIMPGQKRGPFRTDLVPIVWR